MRALVMGMSLGVFELQKKREEKWKKNVVSPWCWYWSLQLHHWCHQWRGSCIGDDSVTVLLSGAYCGYVPA